MQPNDTAATSSAPTVAAFLPLATVPKTMETEILAFAKEFIVAEGIDQAYTQAKTFANSPNRSWRNLEWKQWLKRLPGILVLRWSHPKLQTSYWNIVTRVEQDLQSVKATAAKTPNERIFIDTLLDFWGRFRVIVDPLIYLSVWRTLFELCTLVKTALHLVFGAVFLIIAPKWLRHLYARILALPVWAHLLIACLLWFPTAPWLLLIPRFLALFMVPGAFNIFVAAILLTMQFSFFGWWFIAAPVNFALTLWGLVMLGLAFLPLRARFLHTAFNNPEQFLVAVGSKLMELATRYFNTHDQWHNNQGNCKTRFQDTLCAIACTLEIGVYRVVWGNWFKLRELWTPIQQAELKVQLVEFLESLSCQVEALIGVNFPWHKGGQGFMQWKSNPKNIANFAVHVLDHIVHPEGDPTGFKFALLTHLWGWLQGLYHSELFSSAKNRFLALKEQEVAQKLPKQDQLRAYQQKQEEHRHTNRTGDFVSYETHTFHIERLSGAHNGL